MRRIEAERVLCYMNFNKIKNYINIMTERLIKLWRLSFSLAWTHFKLRNEGSYLGIFWYLLEPLCFFVIILLIGGAINQSPIQHYPLYLFLGLIMFNFFINSTSTAAKAIVSNAGLIKSMNVSRESLVISGIFQFVFSHFIEMLIFLGFMIYFKVSIATFIFYLPVFIFFILFVSGISFMLSVVGVYISDLANVWSVFCRLLWFLTPIFYVMPSNSLLQKISYINPMYHFINISRDVLIYIKAPTLLASVFMIFFSVAFFAVGILIFKKYKPKFAELV